MAEKQPKLIYVDDMFHVELLGTERKTYPTLKFKQTGSEVIGGYIEVTITGTRADLSAYFEDNFGPNEVNDLLDSCIDPNGGT